MDLLVVEYAKSFFFYFLGILNLVQNYGICNNQSMLCSHVFLCNPTVTQHSGTLWLWLLKMEDFEFGVSVLCCLLRMNVKRKTGNRIDCC